MLNNKSIFKDEKTELIASGRIISSPFKKFNKTYFNFKINQLKIVQKETGNFEELNNCGNVFICFKNKNDYEFHLSDFILISLTGMRSYTNKEGGKSYTFESERIISVKNNGYKSYPYILKSKISDCLYRLYNNNLVKTNSSIASALILGNQEEIPQKVSESFKKSGIYHLLAISGLHIFIITGFIYFIFKKISFFSGKKNFYIFYFIIIFLIFYNFIVGEKASMLRSSIMFCLVLFAENLHKDFIQSNIFFLTYIIVLLLNPDYLTNPGFILSFASVGAIIFINPVIKKLLNYFLKIKSLSENYFVKTIITGVSINIFIFPVLSYYFEGFSLISIIANLCVSPVFYILLLDLFISSISAIFWFPAGSFCIIPAGILIDIILKMSDFFISLPVSFINTDIFGSKFIILIYYTGLITALTLLNFFIIRKTRSKEIVSN
ncbi:MAG: ComEC/Rec2 family competence protein [Actinobacteria bacterium]|nr:ComEC/Rec2 family competence protein [Actinomycetota bacterium]